MIYCATKPMTEKLTLSLKEMKYDARAFHADVTRTKRREIQEWFMDSKNTTGIVCATIAFGMGVDKQNIRYVYHYGLPASLEGYAQEIGRAGRDGKPAVCEAIVRTDRDLELRDWMANIRVMSAVSIARLLREFIFNGIEPGSERLISLSEVHSKIGIKEEVTRMVLVYLELEGEIISVVGSNLNNDYKIEALNGKSWTEEPLIVLAKYGIMKKKLLHASLVGMKSSERKALLKMIANLEQSGTISVETAGVQTQYIVRRIPPSDEIDKLAEREHLRAQKLADGDEMEFRGVLQLFQDDNCVNATLRRYFGDSSVSSGWKCDTCFVCRRKRN